MTTSQAHAKRLYFSCGCARLHVDLIDPNQRDLFIVKGFEILDGPRPTLCGTCLPSACSTETRAKQRVAHGVRCEPPRSLRTLHEQQPLFEKIVWIDGDHTAALDAGGDVDVGRGVKVK